jgi:hypothetical protein
MASSPTNDRPKPSLLNLPLEIRQEIYSHLLPPGNVSHPLPSVGIASVTHRLPTGALLNIHPQITFEILDYYHSIATWKIIFSHAFNFFRLDPDLRHLQCSAALPNIRKVEIVFFCDILLLKDYPSFGIDKFCTEIRKRANRACHVLAGARKLQSVTVSWIDTTMTGHWQEKAKILQPLRKLSDGRDITFKIGEVNGPDDVDRPGFVRAVGEILGDGLRLEAGAAHDDGKKAQADMRLLAFDTRQERKHGQPWGW